MEINIVQIFITFSDKVIPCLEEKILAPSRENRNSPPISLKIKRLFLYSEICLSKTLQCGRMPEAIASGLSHANSCSLIPVIKSIIA